MARTMPARVFSGCSDSGKGKPDSKAKRLERLFHKLDHEGLMRPVSVYRNRDMRVILRYIGHAASSVPSTAIG